MIKDLWYLWQRFSDKKKAREIVINAEVTSHFTGVHSIDIIKEVQKKLKKENFYLQKVLREYGQEKPKHEIYRDIFDKNFIYILKMGESKHLPVSALFKDYQEIVTRLSKARKKIWSAIFRPIFIFFIAAFIVYWALGNILEKIGTMRGLDLSFLVLVHKFYWILVPIVPVLILVSVFKFPRKIPFLRSAFKELDAFQYLSFCSLLLSMGVSTVEIVKIFREIMGASIKGEGILGLANFLKDFLNEEETVALLIAAQTYEYERVIDALLNKRRVEFESKIEATTSVLGEVMIFVAMIPVVILLASILTVLSSLSSLMVLKT